METSQKISDFLSKEELREFSTPRNWRAFASLSLNWGVIGLSFAMAIAAPNPLTILLAIVLLGGRQLGLGVLMHDCAHLGFFKSRGVNNFVGHWLCGAPILASVHEYREYHLRHHRFAGTDEDPDIGFVKNYPVARDSLRRKLIRDLTGQTGIRDLFGFTLKRFVLAKHYPWIVFHLLLLATLTAAGAPWAYLMWVAAYLCVYPALSRIRQIGEHGVAVDRTSLDPRDNTSTTIASWWERILIAPNNVHYHLEHHQFAAVPPYNLAKVHHLLQSRGYYEGRACVATGYVDVLRRAVRADDDREPAAA